MTEAGERNPAQHSKFERALENGLFAARWIIAPFYIGLVLALFVLLVVFIKDVVEVVSRVGDLTTEEGILFALSLIDLSLAANLVLVVIFAGYENFVSKMDVVGATERLAWMGTVDFSGLKMKLIASIVAISAIALLREFMALLDHQMDPVKLAWLIGLHLTFVVSGVLMALMDWLRCQTAKH